VPDSNTGGSEACQDPNEIASPGSTMRAAMNAEANRGSQAEHDDEMENWLKLIRSVKQ
jgi:hypothetical protein